MGMGGAARALVNDATATCWNPAMLGAAEEFGFTLSDRVGYEQMNQGYAGLVAPAWGGAVGLSATYFDAGGLDGTNELGEETGEFDATDMSVSVGFGFSATHQLRLGASAGTVISKIDESEEACMLGGVGVAFDVTPEIRVAGVVQNLGTELGEDKLPLVVGGGIGWQTSSISIEGDFANYSGGAYGALGGEYLLGPVALRAGYSSRADAGSGLHAALGFLWDRFFLDYAYVPIGDLGADHHISIGVK